MKMPDLSIKSFKELKELEYVEDIVDYEIQTDCCLVVLPKISERTANGVLKGQDAINEEIKELVRKPGIVVKVNGITGKPSIGSIPSISLEVGDKVYLIAEPRILMQRIVKNALEEELFMYLVPLREIAYFRK